jgi:hypothetical protein
MTNYLPKFIQSFIILFSVVGTSMLLLSCSQPTQLALNNGFGGTGHTTSEIDSGFGGTGVIGTIEAFGSIWVNGIHIEIDHNQLLSSNLPGQYPLNIGQQVYVSVANKNGLQQATEIQAHYPIAGKIEEIRREHIKVIQNWIRINQHTRVDAQLLANQMLDVGQYVIMSGYQTDSGTWLATRLDANPHQYSQQDFTLQWPFTTPKRFVVDKNLSNRLDANIHYFGQQLQFKENRFGQAIKQNSQRALPNNSLESHSGKQTFGTPSNHRPTHQMQQRGK